MTVPPGQLKGHSKKAVISAEDRKKVRLCRGTRFRWLYSLYSCAPQDPFGDVIKKIMYAIHQHAQLTPNSDLGSQNYEQWVVQMERKGQPGVLFLSRSSTCFYSETSLNPLNPQLY